VLKPFREETQTSPVPEYDLDEVGSGAAPEYEQVAGERILTQQALSLDYELCTPVAESLERYPLSLTILPLIC
jgi:hypothetical protein